MEHFEAAAFIGCGRQINLSRGYGDEDGCIWGFEIEIASGMVVYENKGNAGFKIGDFELYSLFNYC